MFAPPCWPSDLVQGAGVLHDDLLIGGTEWLRETGKRGLDEPWFQDEPRGRAVRIEYPGHSQRLECRGDASGSHAFPDDVQETKGNLPEPDVFDEGKRCTGCGSVAIDPVLCELEQKRLGRRDTAGASTLPDGHHSS